MIRWTGLAPWEFDQVATMTGAPLRVLLSDNDRYSPDFEVRELQALVAPKPLQGVLVRGHAGLVVNKFSQC